MKKTFPSAESILQVEPSTPSSTSTSSALENVASISVSSEEEEEKNVVSDREIEEQHELPSLPSLLLLTTSKNKSDHHHNHTGRVPPELRLTLMDDLNAHCVITDDYPYQRLEENFLSSQRRKKTSCYSLLTRCVVSAWEDFCTFLFSSPSFPFAASSPPSPYLPFTHRRKRQTCSSSGDDSFGEKCDVEMGFCGEDGGGGGGGNVGCDPLTSPPPLHQRRKQKNHQTFIFSNAFKNC